MPATDPISLGVVGVVFLATLVRSAFGFGEALVAVPLFDTSNRVTHAIVAAGVAHQLDNARSVALAKHMQMEAQSLSESVLANS